MRWYKSMRDNWKRIASRWHMLRVTKPERPPNRLINDPMSVLLQVLQHTTVHNTKDSGAQSIMITFHSFHDQKLHSTSSCNNCISRQINWNPTKIGSGLKRDWSIRKRSWGQVNLLTSHHHHPFKFSNGFHHIYFPVQLGGGVSPELIGLLLSFDIKATSQQILNENMQSGGSGRVEKKKKRKRKKRKEEQIGYKSNRSRCSISHSKVLELNRRHFGLLCLRLIPLAPLRPLILFAIKHSTVLPLSLSSPSLSPPFLPIKPSNDRSTGALTSRQN